MVAAEEIVTVRVAGVMVVGIHNWIGWEGDVWTEKWITRRSQPQKYLREECLVESISEKLLPALPPGDRIHILEPQKEGKCVWAEWVHSGSLEMRWGADKERWCGAWRVMVRKPDAFTVCGEACKYFKQESGMSILYLQRLWEMDCKVAKRSLVLE